jgi:hypothetical protein
MAQQEKVKKVNNSLIANLLQNILLARHFAFP